MTSQREWEQAQCETYKEINKIDNNNNRSDQNSSTNLQIIENVFFKREKVRENCLYVERKGKVKHFRNYDVLHFLMCCVLQCIVIVTMTPRLPI